MYYYDMTKRFQATITGRVQLVMFRDFAQRKARKLGLVGTAQNLPDGSVYIVAEGDEINLNQLINYLKRGSLLSMVHNVNITWSNPTSEFSDFLIIY